MLRFDCLRQALWLGPGAAHAKAGNALVISGYPGTNTSFDDAMGKFALTYANQAERDHTALKVAVRADKIEVPLEQ